ncbi:MAG: translation initiation factor IF-2, partial [bacterium]|nr:translation initiation factor IF-2 [bacterium]
SKALKERVAPAALPEIARSRRPKSRKSVDTQAVESQLRQTLAAMSEGRRSKKRHKRVVRADGSEVLANVLRLTEFVTTAELANLLEVEVGDLIKKCIGLGILMTMNQRLDKDTIVLLCSEFGTEVEFITDEDEEEEEVEVEVGELLPRQPVVTVMGHVDHGKTTLLDYLRKTNVAAGEHGGITQHIGAYEVQIRDQKITFLDTPGHEAFTAMRARGAQITDIVVLVVAADDQVMPQTLEAIDHAKAAGVPIVIAINKIDKPNAQPEVIKRQLADRGVLIEEWGGKYQSAEIAAKKGVNIEKLLDEILIAAEIAEIKASFEGTARGVVLESRLDKGRGAMATILIQRGTLRVGDAFVAGQQFGKIRMLMNERGERRDEAYPGQPVLIVGFNTGLPQAGDRVTVYDSEREAKDIANRRTQQQREQQHRLVRLMTLEQFSRQQAEGSGFGELNVVIKGDADGSVEVLADSLMKLSGTEVKVNVIRKSVGAITESDVLLAAASHAIIIGFHVHPNVNAREVAEREKVDIRTYRVIYQVVDDVKKALEGLLRPDYKEVVRGTVTVREVFKISRLGTIAGCYVTSGVITRSMKVRLLRDGKELWTGSISSLQRFKDSVREVKDGFECGIALDGYNDLKIGDTIESYETIAEARQLSEQLVM